jgi:DNA-binding NarL/FixJ family response regulator
LSEYGGGQAPGVAKSRDSRRDAEFVEGGDVHDGPVLFSTTPPTPAVELTAQQRQILQLAAEGMTNKEIGERLFLSPRTVSAHVYRLFPKLGVTSRTALREVLTRPQQQ